MKQMTNVEFYSSLAALGINHKDAAAELGLAPRTVQKYIYGESVIPNPVAILVRMRVRGRTRTLNEVMKAHS